jgi:hypothetical protein
MAITVTTKVVTDTITSNSAISGGVIAGDSGSFIPIVDIIMKEEWQLFSQVRQKFTANVKATNLPQLLALYQDPKQSAKPFIVTGFSIDLLNDEYTFELTEYDNSMNINLIETWTST